mgnify:CR=1 FL=1
MPREGFSGGRYHALMMCAALSHHGYPVSLMTDKFPNMWAELMESFGGRVNLENLTIHINRGLSFLPNRRSQFDITICVPDGNTVSPVFSSAITHSRVYQTSLILLNFESPSWFNSTSSASRPIEQWSRWNTVAKSADIIMSSASLGSHYAALDYDAKPGTSFVEVAPAINSAAIRQVPKTRKIRGSIFVPTRIGGGQHKAFVSLARVLPRVKNLRHLTIMVDSPQNDAVISLSQTLEKRGVTVEILTQLSESEKFLSYGKASLTLFPSTFEGFGYPPIESLAMGTPCAVRDLEVYRETCGSDLIVLPDRESEWAGTLDGALAGIAENTAIAKDKMQFYRDKYSIESVGARFESAVEHNVARRPSGTDISSVWYLLTTLYIGLRFLPRQARLPSVPQRAKKQFWRVKRQLFLKLWGRSTLRS